MPEFVLALPRIGEDNGQRPSLSIHDGVTQRRSRTLFGANIGPLILQMQRETDPLNASLTAAEIAQSMTTYLGDYLPDDTVLDVVSLALIYKVLGQGE